MPTRRSEAAVALIRRESDGQTIWLAQWNRNWQAYNFVAGHRRPEETFRQCLVRELGEELGLRADVDCTAAAEPLVRLEYSAWSESARAETQYTMELFEVGLTATARASVDADPQNRWLGAAEIASGRCENGRPVSMTMRRLLDELKPPRAKEAVVHPDPPTIRWVTRERLPERLRQLLEADLEVVFAAQDPAQEPSSVIVSAIHKGFSTDSNRPIVLGVEVRTPDAYRAHIVKLGDKDEVERDYQRWKRCILSQNFASRILVQLHYKELPEKGRAAAIYEDGYLLYGKDQAVSSLEDVVSRATQNSRLDPGSVERVIYQVYTELERWFYVTSEVMPEAAIAFYKARTRNALERWSPTPQTPSDQRGEAQRRADLRRDAIWVLCGHEDYNCSDDPNYLDPLDYVSCALEGGSLPPTLVGRSHGDLHGRNILVGVQRDQAEFPTVFDYGEMDETNVLAWDFAKLETELKVRILPVLFTAPTTRAALLASDAFPQWKAEPRDEDVERTLFLFLFEARLAELTEKIDSEQSAFDLTPLPRELATADEWINRLLRFLWRIRKEAALCLGFRRGRQRFWLDELYFALAVYGLCNAKPSWDYEPPQVLSALVSAGVASARLERLKGLHRDQIAAEEPPTGAVGSYRVPLAHAHRKWKADRLEEAQALLKDAYASFPQSVPLRQEYALVLVDIGRRTNSPFPSEESQKLVEPLRTLCRKYRDHEMLARLGKIFRSHGDSVWHPRSYSDFLDARANDWQYYMQARECYLEAFELNLHYYPGINAATLAWITGEHAQSEAIAGRVRDICRRLEVGSLNEDNRIWFFATEGEACLLMNATTDAVNLYKDVLNRIHPLHRKMAQTMYEQVCRLWWAVGDSRVQGVVDLFRAWELRHDVRFTPGPFGDCTVLSGSPQEQGA